MSQRKSWPAPVGKIAGGKFATQVSCGTLVLMTKESEILNKIRGAVAELDAEHRPQWVSEHGKGYTTVPRPGFDPVGCVMCFPHDGSWPCTTALITDDLISLLPDRDKYVVDDDLPTAAEPLTADEVNKKLAVLMDPKRMTAETAEIIPEDDFFNPEPVGVGIYCHRTIKSGRVCLTGHRLPVGSLFEWFANGASDERILEAFPSCSATEVGLFRMVWDEAERAIRPAIDINTEDAVSTYLDRRLNDGPIDELPTIYDNDEMAIEIMKIVRGEG